jgi:hypothetical protein
MLAFFIADLFLLRQKNSFVQCRTQPMRALDLQRHAHAD